MPLALPLVPQVKRWQRHMFPLILLVLQYMLYRLSKEPPTLLMPILPWPKSEIGNTNTCSHWRQFADHHRRRHKAHTEVFC